MLQEAFVHSNSAHNPASEQDILREFSEQKVIYGEALATFPTMAELAQAYRDTALELAGDTSEYRRNRGKDLIQVANALTRHDGVAELYFDALTGFMTYRTPAPKILNDRAAFQDYMVHNRIDPTSLVDPRYAGIGISALGKDPADTAADAEIAQALFARLPHATTLLHYNYDAFAL